MVSFLQFIVQQNLWDKQCVLSRGECIAKLGAVNQNIFFVQEGALKVYILDDDVEHIIRFAYQHEFAIAIDSFFSSDESSLCIEAIKKSKVYILSKERFYAILESNPNFKIEWMSMLENLLVQQFEREVDLRIESPDKRYQRVLNRSPKLFQSIPLKYIANYLRMAPETLSRLRKP